ncbi:carbonic anhydrase 2-like isoform X2 [Dreissena polymorpha]|nr:carbonic anhydrase 2-like isoform X2 [Dreissena polymorpha]XP_052216881.1 carbonic anhydrase 2-like isoform X2 [Dreissena polymorpha]XP_052216882.1 carbonic anhydrase 2-like isoform X2 [Dreissena polymorpha]
MWRTFMFKPQVNEQLGMKLSTYLILVHMLVSGRVWASDWGYTEENGPHTWQNNYPIAVKGRRQSPINIVSRNAKYDSDLTFLSIAYTPEDYVELKNNGHSIECQITKTGYLTGGPLGNQEFKLAQFHLHWGADDTRGSEHTIDGKQFAAELHLVHWNTKYDSFAEAANMSDGLAVLGIMIQSGEEHPFFSVVSDNVYGLIQPGSMVTIPSSLDPIDLLPANIDDYWTYEGSLTTPPLYESVQWIVFKEAVAFSSNQLDALRSLIDSDGNPMQDNFRPPQPLKGRHVRASFQ